MEENNLKKVSKVLVIVDMINGFVKEGNLADSSISNITDENVRLANMFIKNNEPVIAFRDCHKINSLELNTFPEHCISGTNEVELVDELKVLQNQFTVIDKNSTSGFVVPEFMKYINNIEDLKEVVITGCCTDICIMNLAIPLKNYFNEINKNIDVIVPKNAVDTYNIPNIHDKDEWNEMAFKFMNQAGVTLVKKYDGRK